MHRSNAPSGKDLLDRRKAVVRLLVEATAPDRAAVLRRNMTDDASWSISGDLPVSGVHKVDDLFLLSRGLFAGLAEPVQFSLLSLIGEGASLAMEVEANGVFTDGRRYNHRVFMMVVFVDEKISAIREYADTAHLRDLFGDFQIPSASNPNVLLTKENPMSSEHNKQLARRLFLNVVKEGRIEDLKDIVAADIVDHSENFRGSPSALEDFERHAAFLREVFADLDIEIEKLVAEGEDVVLFWRLSGKHKAPVWSVAPTGRQVSTRTVSTLRFAQGKLVEYESLPDYLDLLSQLGSLGKFADKFG